MIIQWGFAEQKGGFVMFQIKFVRELESIDEPHKWLLSIIEQEAPKVIASLPPSGCATGKHCMFGNSLVSRAWQKC
jgi:hypothetical protein